MPPLTSAPLVLGRGLALATVLFGSVSVKTAGGHTVPVAVGLATTAVFVRVTVGGTGVELGVGQPPPVLLEVSVVLRPTKLLFSPPTATAVLPAAAPPR